MQAGSAGLYRPAIRVSCFLGDQGLELKRQDVAHIHAYKCVDTGQPDCQALTCTADMHCCSALRSKEDLDFRLQNPKILQDFPGDSKLMACSNPTEIQDCPSFALLLWLGLPLGLEAPVMTPNGVIFLFFSFFGRLE